MTRTRRPTATIRIAFMVHEGATFTDATAWVLRRYAPSLRRYYQRQAAIELLRGGVI